MCRAEEAVRERSVKKSEDGVGGRGVFVGTCEKAESKWTSQHFKHSH